jgi:hypothetical protein
LRFVILLLVWGGFLSSMSLRTVSIKVLLNILHILLAFVTISFSTCRCILLVLVLFGEPLSMFTNSHNTFEVIFELVIMFWMLLAFAVFRITLYSFLYVL